MVEAGIAGDLEEPGGRRAKPWLEPGIRLERPVRHLFRRGSPLARVPHPCRVLGGRNLLRTQAARVEILTSFFSEKASPQNQNPEGLRVVESHLRERTPKVGHPPLAGNSEVPRALRLVFTPFLPRSREVAKDYSPQRKLWGKASK